MVHMIFAPMRLMIGRSSSAGTEILGSSEWNEPMETARDVLAHRGNCRSRHQPEPLARADDLDLLDQELQPAWSSTARREQQQAEQELQSAKCFVFHGSLTLSSLRTGTCS
jgi:hypothetical protein